MRRSSVAASLVAALASAGAASPPVVKNPWTSVESAAGPPPPPPDASQCTAEFGSCFDTKCCSNPGFACFKKVGVQFAQCRQFDETLVPGLYGADGKKISIRDRWQQCVDTDKWQCPRWTKCATLHGTCTESMCCADEKNACFRRSHLYHAQCKPAQFIKEGTTCQDDADWLCPGWGKCAARLKDCTLSRCCSDPGYTCALNKTDTSGWHAFCMPNAAVSTDESHAISRLEDGPWWNVLSNVPGRIAFHVDAKVRAKTGLSGPAITVVWLLSTAGLLGGVCVLALHRQRARDRVAMLERELAGMRAKARASSVEHEGSSSEGARVVGMRAREDDEDSAAEPAPVDKDWRGADRERRSSSFVGALERVYSSAEADKARV